MNDKTNNGPAYCLLGLLKLSAIRNIVPVNNQKNILNQSWVRIASMVAMPKKIMKTTNPEPNLILFMLEFS
jgi:hypothetical protein